MLQMFHAEREEDLWSSSLESRACEDLNTFSSLTHLCCYVLGLTMICINGSQHI